MASRKRPDNLDFNLYRVEALRLAESILGRKAEVEDVVQEAYLKAFRFGAQVEGHANPRAWFLQVVANQARDELLKDARRRKGERRASLHRIESKDSGSPSRRAQSNEERRALERALRFLEEKFRIPLLLHYWMGMSFPEVAEIMGVPSSTARVYTWRGVKKLKKVLSQWRYAVVPALLLSLWDSWPQAPWTSEFITLS